MPPLKVCEKLKKKDAQVCDLRFGMYFVVVMNHQNKWIAMDISVTINPFVKSQNVIEMFVSIKMCVFVDFRKTNRLVSRGSEEAEGSWSQEDS